MKTLLNIFPLKLMIVCNEAITILQNNTTWLLFNLKDNTKISINNVSNNLAVNDIVIVNSYDVCTVFKSNSVLIALEIDKTLLSLNDSDKGSYFVCNSTEYKDKSKFSKLKSIIIGLIKENKNTSQAQAFSIAYDIYDELLKNFSQVRPSKKNTSPKILQIIEYIEKNYTENLLLSDIAVHFNFSVPYLSKFFKDSTGKTFADFYDEMRINHSLYDLLETNNTIIDIAYKHGFPNNHAYIRAFKKIVGALPNVTRKSHSEKLSQIDTDDEELNEIIDILELEKTSKPNHEDLFIDVNYAAKSKLVLDNNPSSEILGVGAATDVLHKNIQKIIKDIQDIFPFRYAYIRGIFSDALSFCSRDFDGHLRFKYGMIDEVLDFLLSAKLKPVLSFTYMPRALTKDKEVVFQDGYYICKPSRYDEWRQLVTNFLKHVIARYGIDEISQWIFLPWVQLDSKNNHLGFTDELSFFLFYKESYDAVKQISKDLIVSSPEIFPSEDMEYIKSYLQWTKCNACFPDLLSIKFFPNTNWKVIEIKDNHNMTYRRIIDDEISSDESLMNRLLKNLKNFLSENGYNLDIYITAFNYTITDSHPVLDTLFSANYYLKNYNENLDLIKSLCCWKLSDDDDGNSTSPLFSGSTGMYLKNGIPKGTAQALRFLSYIQRYITDRGDGYILSTCGEQAGYYRLLLYNYEHPTSVKYETMSSPDFDPYSLFTKKKKKAVHFKIENLPYSKATVKMFIMDYQHGSPYNKWISMGKPHLDYYSDNTSVLFDILKTSSPPDFKMFTVPIVNRTLSLEFKLNLFDIVTVEIILSD